MNHESRLKKLEKEVEDLKTLVNHLTKDKWLTLKEASERFDVSTTVLRNQIKLGILKHLKDWKRNGNRYLINPKSIIKIQ